MVKSEYLLHYVWKYRLFDQTNLRTTDGQALEIIDPGLHNMHAGADFFNSKIKIDNKLWAGNVEIHLSSEDWYRHKHHQDKSYNSTILHVAAETAREIFNEKGLKIPQFQLKIPERVKQNATYLLQSDLNIPCEQELRTMGPRIIRSWLNVLTIERLERKTDDVYKHLARFNNSWDQTFYVLLTRNYGFGLNSNEFERLALSLQYNIVQKHSNNIFQVEALMFGQAGMLENEFISDEYYLRLKKEYNFLRHKYQLKPLDEFIFKKMRIRPGSFPQVRIAQLAALFVKSGRLFSKVLEIEDYKQLRLYFQSEVSEYWKTRYSFGKESTQSKKFLGDASLNTIIINTVVPILFAYGKKNDLEKYCERAITILESIKPERNSIVSQFKHAGIHAENAYDTQAMIQLKKEYCDKRKCLYCKIGYKILSQ